MLSKSVLPLKTIAERAKSDAETALKSVMFFSFLVELESHFKQFQSSLWYEIRPKTIHFLKNLTFFCVRFF